MTSIEKIIHDEIVYLKDGESHLGGDKAERAAVKVVALIAGELRARSERAIKDGHILTSDETELQMYRDISGTLRHAALVVEGLI